MDWKSKPVQFAVGVATVAIVLYLVFSGDGILALSVIGSEPAEGETKAGNAWAVLWPILFNIGAIIGAAVIAGVTKVWDWLVGLGGTQSSAIPAATSTSSKITINQASDDLIKAIALGDKDAEDRLRPLVRIPYAQSQAFEAMQAEDFDRARKLLADIEAMSGAKGKVKA